VAGGRFLSGKRSNRTSVHVGWFKFTCRKTAKPKENVMSEYQRNFGIIRAKRDLSPQWEHSDDWLATEEPLEIRLHCGPSQKRITRSLSVTMRTPGHDFELAAGFLVSEKIIDFRSDLVSFRFVGPYLRNFLPQSSSSDQPMSDQRFPTTEGSRSDPSREFFPNLPDPIADGVGNRLDWQSGCLSNIVEVSLDPQLNFDFSRLQRNFYLTSSCGLCGKASLEAIRYDQVMPISTSEDQSSWSISAELVYQLPQRLREKQEVFRSTGGLHAAGLFTGEGDFIGLREDVGRHNALDKLIGAELLSGSFPLNRRVLVLSGRASFELLQKSLLARIPVVVAVGAPSSLAVELAREFDVTLIGFTSPQKFNLYAGEHRVVF